MTVQLIVAHIHPDDIDANADRVLIRSDGQTVATMFITGDDLGERIDNLEEIGILFVGAAIDARRRLLDETAERSARLTAEDAW